MDEQKWYDRPMSRIVLGAFFMAVVYLVLYGFWGNKNPLRLLVDGFICFGGLIFWLFFFAQFILPVRTIPERFKIYERLIDYAMGSHGPALFIENGAIRESTGERLKKGPGVIWLDSASAAVLRNKVKFTQTVGPGVVFTGKGEFIAGVIDLHKHVTNIGPSEKDHPFAPKQDGQSDDEYTALQEKRWQTRALTRDGIEVVATIGVNFGVIDTPPDGGSKPYPFSKNAARQYITAILTPNSSRTDIMWSDLPAQMAVDIWRDYVRRFTIDELFQLRDGDRTGLQIIGDMINKRLGNKTVKELDEFGNPSDNEETSREGTALSQMGISAKATIKHLHLLPDVENRLLQQWPQEWLKNAQRERKAVEQRISLREREGKIDAVRSFAADASLIFGKRDPIDNLPVPAEALIELLHGTRQGIERGGDILRRTSGEIEELERIREWLIENKDQ